MEISAINAVSPKDIDWRRLTAKEIIKYENEGVDVPDEYLQWAKQFQDDLTSAEKSDDTTYEMAASASANANINTDVSSEEVSADGDPANAQDESKLTAEQRRDKMLQDGMSYVKVTRTFTKESSEKASESEDSANMLTDIGSSSDSKVETLESSIDALMAQADELKSQINSLKNKKDSIGLSNLIKIKQLERQLASLGVQGQTMAVGVDSDLNEYNSQIGVQDELNLGNIDHGTVTKEMGDTLRKSNVLLGIFVGYPAIKAGENAIDKGGEAVKVGTDIAQQNNSNLSQVHKLESEIAAKTSVGTMSVSNSDEAAKSDEESENKNDPANKSVEEQTKDVAATGNINEILQYKIRKGEVEA